MKRNSYSIDVEKPRGVVTAKLDGFWTVEIARAYWQELIEICEVAQRRGSTVKILVDAQQLFVQSQEIAEVNKQFAQNPSFSMMKTAIVIANSIFKLQAARIKPSDHHQMFDDITKASSWLMSE